MKGYFKVKVVSPKKLYHLMEGEVVKVNWMEVGDYMVPESFLVNIKGYDNLRKVGYSEKDILVRGLDKSGFTVLVDAMDIERME